MLLQRLREYAVTGQVAALAPPGYLATPIRYVIDLDGAGGVCGVADLRLGASARASRGVPMLAPSVLRTAGVRPRLLADIGEYALGIARDRAKQERVDRARRAFAALVRECAEETGEPAVMAVQAFLDGGGALGPHRPEDYDPGMVITFRVDGVLPIDLDTVRRFWAARGGGEGLAQCLVCGELRPPMQVLAYRWKGIPGGQTAGLALISANAPAFESYGLEQSLNAPTCAECGELFSKAANDLLASDRTRLRLGRAACIFWSREPAEIDVAALLNDPQPRGVEALPAETTSAGGSPFHAAVLSASGARVVVRAWLDTTSGATGGHLARYFRLQEIVGPDGTPPVPLALAALIGATARDLEDVTPGAVTQIVRVALGGEPVPRGLLADALRRCAAEGGVLRPQAALIKMVLLDERERKGGEVGDRSLTQLDERSEQSAYLCGRLLAVLESIQRAALGNVSTSFTERHFLVASSAPAATFGKLLRGVQPHLSKLRRERPAAHAALLRRLSEVQLGLDSFPATLSIAEQGLFALGYYHQRAADRAAAAAARASGGIGDSGN